MAASMEDNEKVEIATLDAGITQNEEGATASNNIPNAAPEESQIPKNGNAVDKVEDGVTENTVAQIQNSDLAEKESKQQNEGESEEKKEDDSKKKHGTEDSNDVENKAKHSSESSVQEHDQVAEGGKGVMQERPELQSSNSVEIGTEATTARATGRGRGRIQNSGTESLTSPKSK